jgi:hypothetical protein
MTYEDIVLPPRGPNEYELVAAEVQTGHTSPYEATRDGRTSQGVSLKIREDGNKILTTVVFSNRPTQQNPAQLCIRCYDWNAYSMNMEECSQKPGWREDGLDYAEKAVPENWDAMSVLIRFPGAMVFAKLPFLEVYDYSTGKEQRQDSLTAKYQDCFHFSRLFNSAVLFILSPEPRFSYRVSWLLGESSKESTGALSPRQKLRQRKFAQELLRMRREVENGAPQPELVKLRDTVNITLASVAEYLQQEIGSGVGLDPLHFELSLMVLDDVQKEKVLTEGIEREFAALRIVAATDIKRPEYAGLSLLVGNGNAGRAWKRRAARVFDRDERDPKRHVYVSKKGAQPHSFLVSIPLLDPDSAAVVYGILNIGTFSESYAPVLRPIGEAQAIEHITSYVQSYVVKKLLEALKV